MFKKILISSLALASIIAVPSSLNAEYALQNGQLINTKLMATGTAKEHYQLGLNAVESCRWDEVIVQFQTVLTNFPDSRYAAESLFYLGIGYFYTGDFDFANQKFSAYLQFQNHPKYFYETLQYKYAIAEQFSQGARLHFLGLKALPCWLSSEEQALAIYDEIIASLPNDELAAKSLYSKAKLLYKMKSFQEAVEVFQTLIRRFPKNELAPESYLGISQAYYCESLSKSLNPDLLGLAQVNIKKFKQAYPGDERIAQAEDQFNGMLETSAQLYLETGYFYERTKHPEASILYYMTTIKQFPNSKCAQKARDRLDVLKQQCPHLNFPDL